VEEMGKLPDEVGKLVGRAPALFIPTSLCTESLSQRRTSVFLKRINSYIAFQDIKPAWFVAHV